MPSKLTLSTVSASCDELLNSHPPSMSPLPRSAGRQARNVMVDVAKGIGIVLVVYGHNPLTLEGVFEEIGWAVYSFHMPLFFIISGMYLESGLPFTKLLLNKWSALIKPYPMAAAILGAALVAGGYTSASKMIVATAYGMLTRVEN